MKARLKKFAQWIVWIFKNPAILAADASRIIAILEKLKIALNSPIAVELVKLIPGETDDRILWALRHGINRVVLITDQLEGMIEFLKSQPQQIQNAAYHKVASASLRQLYPQLSEAEADYIVQRTYLEH